MQWKLLLVDRVIDFGPIIYHFMVFGMIFLDVLVQTFLIYCVFFGYFSYGPMTVFIGANFILFSSCLVFIWPLSKFEQ